MSLIFPVTIVIPILNEAKTLHELLTAIKQQTHLPDEIIFVDAGSNDGSHKLIEDWWLTNGWNGSNCHVIFSPGAMPGAGRNEGVKVARNEWIAFIDGGITPEIDWLEQLCRHALLKATPSVFGVCHFSSDTHFSKAMCAISYGQGSVHPVVPASLFAKVIFEEIGGFPDHLRAAEDILWMAALSKRYGYKEICWKAKVSYTHFPGSWRSAFRKWIISEKNCAIGRVRVTQQLLYFFGLPILYFLVVFGGELGLVVFSLYLFMRGIVDPFRRSADKPWWEHRPLAALIVVPLALMLDFAKWLGIVQGLKASLTGELIATGKNWQPTFVGMGSIRYYSVSRYALLEALILAGVKKGSRVLFPEFICRDLLAPLNKLGAQHCWYKVASNLSPSDSTDFWPTADVVLAVNYFGFPQNLSPFEEYSKRTGALVIEDNAHGYLSRDEEGKWLGCRTSMGIFSVRKTFRVPDGAALWVDSSRYLNNLPAQIPFDGEGINQAQLFKSLLLEVPVFGKLALRLSTQFARSIRKFKTGREIPSSDPFCELELPSQPNPWHGLLHALSKYDEAKEIERRRNAYFNFENYGLRFGAKPVFDSLPNFCAPYAFAFRGDSFALRAMQRYASIHGFDFVKWPDLPTELSEEGAEHYKNIFLVNFLC